MPVRLITAAFAQGSRTGCFTAGRNPPAVHPLGVIESVEKMEDCAALGRMR
jgi:hypothetical protein